MPAIGFEIKRKCKVCGEVFLAKTLDSQYCSPKCSKVAWKRKKDAKEKNEKLDRLAQHIPDIREYVSVKEAVAMFGVERTTLYRLIKNGTVPAINVGKRLTRIKRSALETMFLTRKPNAFYTLSTTFSKLFSFTSINAIRSFPQYLLGMSLTLNSIFCNSASVSLGFLIRIMKYADWLGVSG